MNTQKNIAHNQRTFFPTIVNPQAGFQPTNSSLNVYQYNNQPTQQENPSLSKNIPEQEQDFSDVCEYSQQLAKEFFESNHSQENLEACSDNNNDEERTPSSTLSAQSKKIKKTAPKNTSQKGKKNPWNAQEDTLVLDLIKQYGEKWATISGILGNRTGKQIRDRYLNYLKPDINRDDFSPEEDEQLLALLESIGSNKWSQIASQLPGRTECQVKNRFYTHIKKRLPSPRTSKIQTPQREIETVRPLISNNQSFTKTTGKQEIEYKEEEEKYNVFMNKAPQHFTTVVEPEFSADPNFPTDCISYTVPSLVPRFSYDIQKPESSKIQPFEDLMNGDFFDQMDAQRNQLLASESHFTEEEAFNQVFHDSDGQFENQEKYNKYQELLHKKKILEFMYTKIMQELTRFGGNGYSTIPL